MSISNREEANKYYNQLNKLVDAYTENHKIKPSSLRRYLKPGSDRFKRFLKRNNLDNVSGADRILNDIIEDRVNMEEDGVMTFEGFKYFESQDFVIDSLTECLYKGIDSATNAQEKILADYFDVNLGDLEVKDSHKHLFDLKDWKNDDWKIVIYSEEEIELIKENIIDHLYEQISSKEIELIDDIVIEMSKLVNREIFEEKLNSILTEKKLNKIISDCLGEDWSFESNFRDSRIWIS